MKGKAGIPPAAPSAEELAMLSISSIAVSPLPPQAPTVARVLPTTPAKASDNVTPENQGVVAPVAPAGEGSRAQVGYAPSSLPPVNPTGETPRANNFNNTAVPERVGQADAFNAALAGATARQASIPTSQGESPMSEAEAFRNLENGNAQASRQATEPSANAQAQARAQAQAQRQRYEGELPPEVKNPAMEVMDNQIKELLPNMWKASRAAVDVLIGDEARAAAAARAEVLFAAPPATSERGVEAADNYTRTSNLPELPSSGRNVDRLV
jgi:hypothetical protein